jgi:hypothetical protein
MTETLTLANTYCFAFRPRGQVDAKPQTGSVHAANAQDARRAIRSDTRMRGQTLLWVKPARSWKVAALVRGESGPSYNAVRYANWQDADDAGSSLLWRWSLMMSYVVEPSEDEPNA